MSELRKDPILGFWVIINEKRGERPRQFKKPEIIHDDKGCYFCPGNENTTPPEIGRVEEKGEWKIRWFDNKFPILKQEASVKITKAKDANASRMDGYGYHEVVVDTNDHSKQLWDLPVADIYELLKIYSFRMKELSQKKNVSYVLVFKNHGVEGGTSIVHSHTQIITTPFLPQRIEAEMRATADAKKKGKKCPHCSIIAKEKKGKRFVAESKNFIILTPYASRFNYEVWILSKKHEKEFIMFDDERLKELARMLQIVLLKLKELNCSYNFFLHYGPRIKGKQQDLHFHIEVTPRKATWAGFELGSDIVVNSVSPETAAKFYRGEEGIKK